MSISRPPRTQPARPASPTRPASPAASAARASTPAPPSTGSRDSFTADSSGSTPRTPDEMLNEMVAARKARARTSQIHVERGIQSDPAKYEADLSGWLKETGDELASREINLRLSDGIQIKNGDDLKALQERAGGDLRGLATELGIPPREVHDYLVDLHHLVDDMTRSSSQLQGGVIDAGPGSELGRALGLDKGRIPYATAATPFGALGTSEAMKLANVELGKKAFEKVNLDGQLYMDATTFDGQRTSSGRSSVELEVVKTIGGLESKDLLKLMRTERNGRTVFRRMTKPTHAEAFSLGHRGVPIDEMRWDSRAHATREQNPYVSLTVENGRMEKDARSGEWEVSVGTDINVDHYYDTPDFALLGSDMSIRSRVRLDRPGEIRRILVQSKIGSGVDETGMKQADKKDIRVDRATFDQAAKMDETIRTGKNHISRGAQDRPVEALAAIYDGLKDKGLLPDIGDKKDVLLLEDKAVVNSVRSRYHLNFTSEAAMKNLLNSSGMPMIRRVRELTEKAGPGLDPSVRSEIVGMAKGLEDGSLLARECKTVLEKLDPNMTVDAASVKALMPGASGSRDKLDVRKRQVVAETMNRLYHEFSEKFDAAKRDIAGANERPFRRLTETFVEWKKETDPAMRAKQTTRPFLDAFDQMLASPDFEDQLKAFNEYAMQNGRDTIASLPADEQKAAFGKLKAGLVEEDLDIMHRQIEAAGSMGQALWLRQASSAYVTRQSEWSNFLIDTFDMAESVKPEDWNKLSEDQRRGRQPIPADKIFRATVVNEVQIELGLEKPYMEKIAGHEKTIAEARASMFMKFAQTQMAGASGFDPGDMDSYRSYLKETLALPKAEREARLAAFNSSLQSSGSFLRPLTNEELGSFDPAAFAAELRDKAVDTSSTAHEDLDMCQFIFSQLQSAQENIAAGRERRIRREARRAGVRDLTWENAETSKGDGALRDLLAGNA